MAELIKGVLDPGHAPNTPGKRLGKFREYASNQAIAVKVKKMLEATGRFKIQYSVDLDKKTDKSLYNRALTARQYGAEFYVSIHSNAHSNSSVRGTETFIHDNTAASVPFAQQIHNNLVESLGTKNRGLKRANFGVLRHTYQYMLSALTEGEFFTNPDANKWMITADYENRYAKGIYNGLCEFYNVSPVVKPHTPVKPLPVEEADDEGALLIRVIAKQLWTYESQDWNDKAIIVEEDEVFTTRRKVKVDGAYMYQLKSGLYITASDKYVRPAGTVKTIAKQPEPSNKRILIVTPSLWTYKTKDWNDKAVVVKKGEVFTLASGKLKVDGAHMYKLKSGLYITASEKYVKVI